MWDGEPFLPRTCWKYILRAFQWARKYGLRVSIDLHTAPGSQNGAFCLPFPSLPPYGGFRSVVYGTKIAPFPRAAFNHSGKKGTVAFLVGDMGYANAQRMLNYIRIFTEFISQPEFANVVVMFGITNEPVLGTIGRETLTSLCAAVFTLAFGLC